LVVYDKFIGLYFGGIENKESHMSEIGKSIDQVVNSGLAERLKKLGYRKNARIFYIRTAEYTKIVQVSASRFNLPRKGHFEIKLAVDFPNVAQVLEKPPLKQFRLPERCIIWSSVSRLAFDSTHRKEDVWYEIDLDRLTDLPALAQKIGEEWDKYGHPWIDRVTDPEQAAKELSNRGIHILSRSRKCETLVAKDNIGEVKEFFHCLSDHAYQAAQGQPISGNRCGWML
jgi:hypothetical protein